MRRGPYYRLNGHEVEPVSDILAWGQWFETAREERVVKQDGDEASGWFVSTVFLGIDHNFRATGPPVLFESLVMAPSDRKESATVPVVQTSAAFTEKWDGHMDRYTTWEEAREGHARIVREIARDLQIDQA